MTILELEARRTKAMVDADLATLRELVADDCRYVHSTSAIDTKASYLDKLERGIFRYTWLKTSEQVVIEVGDSFVISHRMDAEIVMGEPRPYSSRAVAVWRGGARPQLVYFQATTLPQEGAKP